MDVDAGRVRSLLPLYAGLLGMAGSTVAALGLAIDSPDFVVRCHVLVALGLTASLLGAAIGRNPSVLGAVVASVVFPLLVLSNTGQQQTRLFFPDETLTDHTLLLPTLAVWGIIALAFAQVNRSNSIFIFVCGLVVFGLTGTININESLLVSFLLFLLSTFFVWGYNNALDLRERAEQVGQVITPQPLRWAHTQIGVGAALTAIVFALAVISGYPTYTYTRNFLVTPFSQRHRRIVALPLLRNYAGFSDKFTLTGGPIRLNDAPALTVRADAPALWRGLVYDYYRGTGWEQSASRSWRPIREVPEGSDRYELPRGSPYRPETKNVKLIRQRITAHVDTAGTLMGAATPVFAHGVSYPVEPKVDSYGCLHGDFPRRTGRIYELHSLAATPTVEELMAAPEASDEWIRDRYLQVPVETRAKLEDLANEITGDCDTAYEKVKAIEAHLYDECRYTFDVPPIPPNQDAVAYFLLTTRRGACDLYSSALVMLLRLLDVPARVVTGYATGEWDPDKEAYEVTGAEAHAWAEVYFPGIGWVEFDPPSQKAPDHLSWLTKLFQPGWTGPTLRMLARRIGMALIVLVLVNALILAISGVSPVQIGARWVRRRRRSTNPRQRVALAYLTVCRQLDRRGVVRDPWQTPTDFAREVVAHDELADPIRQADIPGFTDEFLRLRYGALAPSADEVSRFVDRAHSLARRIRHGKRNDRRSRGAEPPDAPA